MFCTEMLVRFSDCDALGHLNNAVYFTYFEEARTEIFRIFNPELSLQKWNLIVASTCCDFLQETKYAEKIKIYTWISRIGNSSFDVDHAIYNDRGFWTARGKAILLCYDYHTKKSIPLSEEIRIELGKHSKGPEGAPKLRAK